MIYLQVHLDESGHLHLVLPDGGPVPLKEGSYLEGVWVENLPPGAAPELTVKFAPVPNPKDLQGK